MVNWVQFYDYLSKMPNLLKQVTEYFKKKEQDVPVDIKKVISLTEGNMTCFALERLFDRSQPYLDSNSTGSQNPISYLLLLLLWMKIHGPFPKSDLNTWIVDENTRIELPNDYRSCNVAIISFGKRTWSKPFNSDSMVAYINTHMMTEEELAKQEKLRNKEQALNDALENAHKSGTCAGYSNTSDGCPFCKENASWEQISKGGPGT